MASYAYLRRDNDSAVQKRELVKIIAEYAARLGIAAPPSEFTVEDGCSPLVSLDSRDGFSALRRRLSEGDTVLVTHWSAIGGHSTSLEKFLREANAKGVSVFCAEMQTELTSKLSSLKPILAMAGHWESALIAAEQQLADKDALHEEMLEHYSKLAVQAAAERFMKSDVVGALRDAMRSATVEAALCAQGKKRASVLDLVSPEALENMRHKNPKFHARYMALRAAEGGRGS